MSRQRIAVVLAAGKGTRLRSSRAKVLHQAGGRTLLEWVLAAAREAGCDRLFGVIGHQAERVRQLVVGDDLDWVMQLEQRGTGHALAQAETAVRDAVGDGEATLLVLSGDVPLVKPETLVHLVEAAERGWGSMAIADLDEPGSLGRVLVDEDGHLSEIVEAADASAEQRAVTTINAGLYALPVSGGSSTGPDAISTIFDRLRELDDDNAQGEIYLTEALNRAARGGDAVELVRLEDPSEALGVNTRAELVEVHRRLNECKCDELMSAGVTIYSPSTTTIDATVEIGADTIIHPGVAIHGSTTIGADCEIRQGAWIADSDLADQVVIEPYSVLEDVRVAEGCRIGPFARLRPATVLDEGVRIGNFVEVKKSHLGPGVKAGHLAYLGDAQIGAETNIGAGAVTCNYDGHRKHRTDIGERAFIGSDTMLIAPVTIGAEAMTAAGSTIHQDVPEGALAIGRARQKNLDRGARRRLRPKGEKTTDSAETNRSETPEPRND